MSSQILAYGYIEMPQGKELENEEVLAQIRKGRSGCDPFLNLSPIRSGWRASICSFAASCKRTASNDCDRIREAFEHLLMKLSATSAHLTLEDPGMEEMYYFDYAYGPTKIGERDVWTRARSRRELKDVDQLGDSERFEC